MSPEETAELDALSQKYSRLYEAMEEQWIERHRKARLIADTVPDAAQEGLYNFLVRHLDDRFDKECGALYEKFDVEAGQLEARVLERIELAPE